MTAAIFHQQAPTDEVWQTSCQTMGQMEQIWLQRGDRRPAQGSAVLQGETQQAGNAVVESDHFSRAIGSYDAPEEFRRLLIAMDAQVERALAGEPDLLGDARHWLIILSLKCACCVWCQLGAKQP